MKSIIMACLCIQLAVAAHANQTDTPAICGDWIGTASPESVQGPHEQQWILTFQKDGRFSFHIVEEGTSMGEIEGGYTTSRSSVLIQLPELPPVKIVYSIQNDTLCLDFAKVLHMLGAVKQVKGPQEYTRTKDTSALNKEGPLPAICGEWTAIHPDEEWILTFRQDSSFILIVDIGQARMIRLQGGYSAFESNVLLRLPETFTTFPVSYSIEGNTLNISFSDADFRWGDIVDSYVKTQEGVDLPIPVKQTPMKQGQYKFRIVLRDDNDENALRKTFGDQYRSWLNKPIESDAFPLRELHGRNYLELRPDSYGPPEFDGNSFRVKGAVYSRANNRIFMSGDFAGEIVSPTQVKGSFVSTKAGLHGTFTLERVGGL